MQKKKIADLTNYSVLTVESSEDVAIIPTSEAHLKNSKFILKHEDWIANKVCRSLHVSRLYIIPVNWSCFTFMAFQNYRVIFRLINLYVDGEESLNQHVCNT